MVTTVRTRARGPLVLEGDFEVYDQDGNKLKIEGPRVLLCRCGASSTSPRCDGSHNRVSFEAPAKQVAK